MCVFVCFQIQCDLYGRMLYDGTLSLLVLPVVNTTSRVMVCCPEGGNVLGIGLWGWRTSGYTKKYSFVWEVYTSTLVAPSYNITLRSLS